MQNQINKKSMLNTEKQELVSHLLKADEKTIWGSIINNFINDINNKSDNDLLRLISELKQAAVHNQQSIKDILKDGYDFIIKYQMPTDFAPTESEGKE